MVTRIEQAAQGLPVEIANVTVSARELEGTSINPLNQLILETAVWDESRWDQSVWGGESENALFEKLLKLVSNGSFPATRDHLTHGQSRQMRDVMILLAHTREGRDILITDEKKAFVGKDGSLKDTLQSLCSTLIMNTSEFCDYCNTLKRDNNQVEQESQ